MLAEDTEEFAWSLLNNVPVGIGQTLWRLTHELKCLNDVVDYLMDFALHSLDPSDEWDRCRAVECLGYVRESSTLPELRSLADTCPADSVRVEAACSMARMGDFSRVHVLISLLKSPIDDVAARAAYLLGQVGGSRAVPYLLEALRHPSTRVNEDAVTALCVIGDVRAVPFIIRSYDSTSGSVQEAVTSHLYAFGRFPSLYGTEDEVVSGLLSHWAEIRSGYDVRIRYTSGGVPWTLEELVRGLKSEGDAKTLTKAGNCWHDLCLATDAPHLGFDDDRPVPENVEAVQRWQAWYEVNKDKYLPGRWYVYGKEIPEYDLPEGLVPEIVED